MLTQHGDGELRLAGSFGDEFGGTTLDTSRWVAGAWTGGGLFADRRGRHPQHQQRHRRLCPLAVRGNSPTLEATAQFGAGPWQHIGYGDLGFDGNVYTIFSTLNSSDNLYARTNNNASEQRTDLGAIPSGLHTYRVEVAGTQVSYYIDGTLRAQHTCPAAAGGAYLPVLQQRQRACAGGRPPVRLSRLHGSGSVDSCTIDGGAGVNWTTADWDAGEPAGTSVQLRTRTSADASTWSAWSAPLTAAGQTISSPDQRYLQYQVELSTSNSAVSAVVDAVGIGYSAVADPPTPTSTRPIRQPIRPHRPTPDFNTPTPTNTPTNTPTPPTHRPIRPHQYRARSRT